MMANKLNISIPRPCKEEVDKYLKNWDENEEFVKQDFCLNALFKTQYPKNNNIYEILTKVTMLNVFYGTNIFKTYPVAKHILEMNIDKKLTSNDDSIIDDISKIEINGKKVRLYSFATKYCSFHNPEAYPIYDSFVEKVLNYFRCKDHFADFKIQDLKNYSTFKEIVNKFVNFYNLEEYSVKDIDRYLWQVGKEYFK